MGALRVCAHLEQQLPYVLHMVHHPGFDESIDQHRFQTISAIDQAKTDFESGRLCCTQKGTENIWAGAEAYEDRCNTAKAERLRNFIILLPENVLEWQGKTKMNQMVDIPLLMFSPHFGVLSVVPKPIVSVHCMVVLSSWIGLHMLLCGSSSCMVGRLCPVALHMCCTCGPHAPH